MAIAFQAVAARAAGPLPGDRPLLFAGFRLLHLDAGTSSGRIELTEDDLRQMTVAWLAQGRPPILYREALALGPGAQKEPGSRTRSTPTAG